MTERLEKPRLRRIAGRIVRKSAYICLSLFYNFWSLFIIFLLYFLGVTILLPPSPIFIWNSSASAPIGLYYVKSIELLTRNKVQIQPDDMVAAWPPKAVRKFAADRHYLPAGVPLIKRVAAAEHDSVCADGDQIIIDGGWVIPRRKVDAKGRALPQWHGCHVLETGELFLMMEEHPDSFDGRYFGVTAPDDVIGKAILLWAY